jgi:hypothetical protein
MVLSTGRLAGYSITWSLLADPDSWCTGPVVHGRDSSTDRNCPSRDSAVKCAGSMAPLGEDSRHEPVEASKPTASPLSGSRFLAGDLVEATLEFEGAIAGSYIDPASP